MAHVSVSKKQFERDPRANEIRNLCLQIATLLQAGNVENASVTDNEQVEQVTKIAQKLQDMGISPGMHVGLPEDRFADPLMMAEFTAGQAVKIIKDKDYRAFNMLITMTFAYLDAN